MKEEYQRISIQQDDDGHTYIIPYHLKDDFIVDLTLLIEEDYKNISDWETIWSNYQVPNMEDEELYQKVTND